MLLKDRHVILASGSPRRIAILKEDGVDFEIIKPGCKEDIHLDLSPAQTVMALALRKGLAIGAQEDLVISCDTVVVNDGKVIGKPKDQEDAFNILSELRGKDHEVISGVCLIYEGKAHLFNAVTKVFFKDYSDEEIREYIATGEPMDKAGAYAIQGLFGKYVDHIEGEYNNVVGFPYDAIKKHISEL